MNISAKRWLVVGMLCIAAAALPSPAQTQESHAMSSVASKENEDIVRRAFEAWAAGTGGPYDLLNEDARWTIVGRSAAAGTYGSRESFMQCVIRPFNARMREPLKPTIRGLYTSEDMVIVFFDAKGLARDGIPYENTYTWYLRMRDGRIIESVAFFDSIAFNELWQRVTPASTP